MRNVTEAAFCKNARLACLARIEKEKPSLTYLSSVLNTSPRMAELVLSNPAWDLETCFKFLDAFNIRVSVHE